MKPRPYGAADVAAKLKDFPGWSLQEGAIRRTYETGGWPASMRLANAIGDLAEAANHHPDLLVTWGSLTVMLSSHDAGGITDRDFNLARKIEDLASR